MPVLDSFRVDHTRMIAPAVRIAKKMNSPSGDAITVYDIRFYQPNKDLMSGTGIHTMEHLFAGFMRVHLNSSNVEIIDVSPMGCRTGFYMSLMGLPNEADVAKAWKASMEDVLKVASQDDIPELNEYQCGTFKMHSLDHAHKIANDVLSKEIGVMDNDELYLTEEKMKELGI